LYFTTSHNIDAQDWQDWIMAAPADAHQIHFTNPVCGKDVSSNLLADFLKILCRKRICEVDLMASAGAAMIQSCQSWASML